MTLGCSRGRCVRPKRGGFTLVELLVVVSIIAVLAALMLPALSRSKASARRADCLSNLRQMGFATQLYWEDNSGRCFTWFSGATNGGWTYWFGWLGNGPEGQRPVDLSVGALSPYLRESAVRLCPSLNESVAQFKPKADRPIAGYGYNIYLSGVRDAGRLGRPTDLVLFADAAMINDFQAPASRSNPMLEEWFYVSFDTNVTSRSYYPNGHFRHSKKANVVFCDSHAGGEVMVAGSLDPKLPSQCVGQLRPEILRGQ